jgi:hypothetical protein
MAVVDELSPEIYGQDLILLSLTPLQTPRQFEPVTVDVDYAQCLPAGIVLPLEMTVTSESGAALFQRAVFRRYAPTQLTFIPREGGSHLIRLAESHHNRWFGALQIEVLGERVNQR